MWDRVERTKNGQARHVSILLARLPSAGRPMTDNYATASRQVDWWNVHEFVAPFLEAAGSWPACGSPAWCALDAGDPVKLAALFDNAQHHALRVETCQQAECEAARAISAAADWPAIAQHNKDRAEFYAERPWLKRKTT
jgi:Protein of unknown function (DUF2742)